MVTLALTSRRLSPTLCRSSQALLVGSEFLPRLAFRSDLSRIFETSLRYLSFKVEPSYSPKALVHHRDTLPDSINPGPKAFIDELMIPLSSLRLDDIKAAQGKSCIIDNPDETMANTYLDQESLKANVKNITYALNKKPNSRSKPLLATVMGSGGGKTRLLEECRRILNEKNNTLVISVTFNNDIAYSWKDENFFDDDKFIPFNMLMSVLIRVMNVALPEDFDNIQKRVHRLLMNQDKSDYIDSGDLIKMFRYAMGRIVCAINVSNRTSLEGLVLMVDEVIKLREETKYEDANLMSESFKQAMQCLQQAMLSKYIPQEDRDLKAALVISSLELSALSKTDRVILHLIAPAITAEEVVSKWWLINSSNCNKRDRFRLELIASTLLGVPRLLQFAKEYIDSTLPNLKRKKMSKESIQSLYLKIFEAVQGRYKFNIFLATAKRKSALIFQEVVAYEETDTALFRISYFTGSLPTSKYDSFIPRGSIFMLAACDIFGTGMEADLDTDEIAYHDTS